MKRPSDRLPTWLLVLALACTPALGGCVTMGLRSAVDLSVTVADGTPPDALVYIDGHYVGSLAAVAARGVRIPEGKHRFTVEKAGYFPVDTIILSRTHPIKLQIDMLRLPE